MASKEKLMNDTPTYYSKILDGLESFEFRIFKINGLIAENCVLVDLEF